jgi:hypothetical protein
MERARPRAKGRLRSEPTVAGGSPAMSESQPEAPAVENRAFTDILKSLLGHTVTVVNPESYEHAPVGHQIKPGFYRAKLVSMGTDYIALMTEDKKPGKDVKEPVKQFMPITRIKRVSVMKSGKLIHI